MANPLVENDDVVLYLTDSVDDHQYFCFSPVSAWKMAWEQRPKITRVVTAHSTVPQLVQSFQSGIKHRGAVREAAASLGRLDLLQYARAYGCPWPDAFYSEAAAGVHDIVMAWTRAYDCPLKNDTCPVTAVAGHLKALQWAHANGCPSDENTCCRAAIGGHLALLQ